ncbi:hypothetical protein DYD21_02735 [Rhodohalobacter sp. SW132]|uniref:GlsB/YeaQ/YmgE family stress response membrane protein n=1 Tax=Rhodohalobacter sp. SW132 TaxID=2293433 RepID=UPI000E2456A3|nr:hypothetical protein [Rhodohalobacter sp. SW132]REL38886.1 hypothetical protein DYD21_02735 [Rhodohalobacter sp. SW132]
MEELNGVTIYWLISIGLLVGFIIDLLMMKKGIGMIGNVVWGAIGSIIVGVSMILLGVFAPLIYATLGSIAFLFLINVFSFDQEHKNSAQTSQ